MLKELPKDILAKLATSIYNNTRIEYDEKIKNRYKYKDELNVTKYSPNIYKVIEYGFIISFTPESRLFTEEIEIDGEKRKLTRAEQTLCLILGITTKLDKIPNFHNLSKTELVNLLPHLRENIIKEYSELFDKFN